MHPWFSLGKKKPNCHSSEEIWFSQSPGSGHWHEKCKGKKWGCPENPTMLLLNVAPRAMQLSEESLFLLGYSGGPCPRRQMGLSNSGMIKGAEPPPPQCLCRRASLNTTGLPSLISLKEGEHQNVSTASQVHPQT